ncbi:Heterokaryon incompatibility protein (HET) domain containing protein [Hyaloscypha variabilis]
MLIAARSEHCPCSQASTRTPFDATCKQSACETARHSLLCRMSGGMHAKKKPICADGKVFEATANLESALRHIRKADVAEVLWVDAVCINQEDTVEQNQQVHLMKSIYSEAHAVLIWLGDGDEHSDTLFEIISKDEIPSPPDGNDDTDTNRLQEQFAIELYRIHAMLSTIAKRPWWTRVWIVQECLLPEKSPIIQCGGKTLLWDDFFEALWTIQREIRHTAVSDVWSHPSVVEFYNSAGISRTEFSGGMPLLELLHVMRFEYAEKQRPYSFSMIMHAFLGRKATVLHDYVFGFLGLVSEEKKRRITIDYERPCWEMYRDLTKELLSGEDDEELSVLASVSFQSSRDTGHRPSWVPDFSSQVHHTHQDNRYTGLSLAFEDLWRYLETRFSSDGNILMIRGVYLDVIWRVSPFGEDGDKFTEVLDRMERRARTTIKKQQRNFRDQGVEPLFKASSPSLRRLFSANCQEDPEIAGVTQDQLDFWWDVFQATSHEKWDDLVEPESQRTREELAGHSTGELILSMLHSAKIACFGRNLIVTEKELLLGICVPGVRKGDVLVCLFGMSMPWVLRPAKGRDYYTVVGGAFIHGLTNWTVLDECYDKGRLCEATFRIR